MDELLDMMVSDESPSQISDQIKDMLYAKSAKKIDELRPVASGNLFGAEAESEVETEVETQPEEETND